MYTFLSVLITKICKMTETQINNNSRWTLDFIVAVTYGTRGGGFYDARCFRMRQCASGFRYAVDAWIRKSSICCSFINCIINVYYLKRLFDVIEIICSTGVINCIVPSSIVFFFVFTIWEIIKLYTERMPIH